MDVSDCLVWYVQADYSKLWAPRTAQLLAGVIHEAFPPDASQLSQLFTLFWALIFLFVLFPGILPGAIALALHNLGILGRLMAEVTENLDECPLRSLKALGATAPQVFLYC